MANEPATAETYDRLQVMINRHTADAIRVARIRYRLSLADFVARVVGLYVTVRETMDDGGQVLLVDKRGNVKEIVEVLGQ